MPNTKSAIRRVRRVKKQTQVNRIRKSKYKNAVKQMEILIKSKKKEEAKCEHSFLVLLKKEGRTYLHTNLTMFLMV